MNEIQEMVEEEEVEEQGDGKERKKDWDALVVALIIWIYAKTMATAIMPEGKNCTYQKQQKMKFGV